MALLIHMCTHFNSRREPAQKQDEVTNLFQIPVSHATTHPGSIRRQCSGSARQAGISQYRARRPLPPRRPFHSHSQLHNTTDIITCRDSSLSYFKPQLNIPSVLFERQERSATGPKRESTVKRVREKLQLVAGPHTTAADSTHASSRQAHFRS